MTYLGLPLCRGQANKMVWNLVLERVERKLSTWKANYLSLGGRITLIMEVMGNLPIYFMSILECPIFVINGIEKLQWEFLWHGRSAERKFHLIDWALVCTSKLGGGLGIKSEANESSFAWKMALGWLWGLEERRKAYGDG